MTSRRRRSWAGVTALPLALLALSCLVACASNPPATDQTEVSLLSTQQEIDLGRKSNRQILDTMGAYADPDLQAYVSRVGRRLAQVSGRPDLPWTFAVIDDPSVNAFALPSGYVYLTRGMLAYMSSEAEMAAVLGHEIGHVTARQAVERMGKSELADLGLAAGMILAPGLREDGAVSQAGLGMLFLKFSRDNERQADDLAFSYIDRAGYDPREMVAVLRVLERASQGSPSGRLPDWLSTHPDPTDRLLRLQTEIEAEPRELLGTAVGRATFLQKTDGIVFGQDPREGFFEGATFYQPRLGFRVSFPEGWQTSNQRQTVGAVSPKEDAVVALSLIADRSPDDAARRFFAQEGVVEGASWSGSLGGLPAVAKVFRRDRASSGEVAGLVAFVADGNRVFRLLGYGLADHFERYREAIESSLGSFSLLTDPRYLGVEPKRIEQVTLPQAMTIDELQAAYPSTVSTQTLAILNHVEAGQALAAGSRAKRVVGGTLP